MSGMVFLSKGFAVGSGQYNALTSLVSILVIVSTFAFVAFVVFEVYRSIRFAKAHEAARLAEAERLEERMMAAAGSARALRKSSRLLMSKAVNAVDASPTAVPPPNDGTGAAHDSARLASASAALSTRKSRMLNMARGGTDGGTGGGSAGGVGGNSRDGGRAVSPPSKHVPTVRGGHVTLLADGLSAGGYRGVGALSNRVGKAEY